MPGIGKSFGLNNGKRDKFKPATANPIMEIDEILDDENLLFSDDKKEEDES